MFDVREYGKDHGYTKRFGTEVNCLRWFSVLFNTLEISIKLLEAENNK